MNDLNKVLAFDIGTKKISCLAAIKSKEESIIYQEFKECDSNGINKGNIINQEQFEIQILKLMNSFKSFLDEDPVILIGNSSKDVKEIVKKTGIKNFLIGESLLKNIGGSSLLKEIAEISL